MTCYEKYISEHELSIVGCPHDYGYLQKPSGCYSISCYKDCWSREVPEEVIDKLNSVGNTYPVFPDELPPKIAFLCDRQACERCSYPSCRHTTDISHAKNFRQNTDGKYMEVRDSTDD